MTEEQKELLANLEQLKKEIKDAEDRKEVDKAIEKAAKNLNLRRTKNWPRIWKV